MKKITLLLNIVVLTSALYGQAVCDGQQVVLTEDGICNYNPYVLVFEDNFDGNTLDLTKWNPITGVPRDFNFDVQKAWHLPENVEVSNGTLKIITKKLTTPYTGTWVTNWSTSPPTTKTSNFDYTTGEIWSNYKFGHGRFEIRCKLPKGKGFFPAFWTYAGNPWNEIDVFEFWNEKTLGIYDPSKLSKVHKMNAHYDFNGDGNSTNCPTKYTGPDFSQSFHTFIVVWTPYKIMWYVDFEDGNGPILKRVSTLFYTMLGQIVDCNGINAWQQYILDKAFPRNPMHIIANLAIQSGADAPDSNTPFPSALEIDYIRYYKQMPCDGSLNITDVSSIDISPGVYNIIIGASISLSGNFTLQSGQQLEVIARDEIILGPGFTAEAGSNFVARIDEGICIGANKMAEILDTDDPSTNLDELLSEQNGVDKSNSLKPLSVVERIDCNVKIFPNPSKGRITVELTLNSINNYEIFLLDMQGKILYSQSPIQNTNIEIDITGYSSGTYLLNVIDIKEKIVYSHKIIKD
jgi:beta-glucanase (GH16 family)